MSNIARKLQGLQPSVRKTAGFTREEGELVIRLLRSGVTLGAIEERLDVPRGNVYDKIGVWAIRFASIPESDETR